MKIEDSLPLQDDGVGSIATPSSSTLGTPNVRGTKRKESDPVENSESSPDHGASTSDSSKDPKLAALGKRTKTARACDSCRRKKIRCDVQDDSESLIGSLNNGNGGLVCAHCRQYGFECTFFLPITETRFKKKHQRDAEQAAAAAAAAASSSASRSRPTNVGAPSFLPFATQATHPYSGPNINQLRHSLSQEWPARLPTQMPQFSQQLHPQIQQHQLLHNQFQKHVQPQHHFSTPHQQRHIRPATYDTQADSQHQLTASASAPDLTSASLARSSAGTPPPDTRVLGPTSIAYIVHSTAFVPGAAIEAHDIKHNQTFEVGASGDGIIRFHKARKHDDPKTAAVEGEDDEVTRIPDSIKGRLAGDVAEKLVNTYFEKVATLFPVVTKSEFLHLSPPPPLLLYAICGVAALSRDVPKEVLGAVKMTINALFRENDFLSSSNSVTVRALLVMSLHPDLHGPTALQSGSRCWNRTGCAIRMAQDLGLHRDASGKDDLSHNTFFLEQKRRIWGCCVTADRIQSISLGHPLMIDLTDCDVRLPSPFEILRSPTDPRSDVSTDRPFTFNTEMLKLTILFGRVMKTIYSPTGLMNATDIEITSLLHDIDAWKASLPAELVFKGPQSSPQAGILHVGFACLMMLFFRVFMRISYICPTHLKFSLTIERMSSLIQYSADAISWVDNHAFYLDTMQIVSYCLVSCATVQYHAWIRRGDQNAQNQLRKLNEVMSRYRSEGDDTEDSSMRGKAASVIALLCDSAGGVYANTPSSGTLNPTAGVTNRRSKENVRGIVFRPDASRPGGGVYVAADKNSFLRDLPKGTIILQENQDGRCVPALVRTGNDQNGGWQTFEQFRAAMLGASKDGMDPSMANLNLSTLNAPMNDSTLTNNGSEAMSTSASMNGSDGPVSQQMTSMAGNALGPPGANLIHLGGDVWQDAEGRPVTRSGSRLVTMVPVNPGASSNTGNAAAVAAFSDVNFMPSSDGTQLSVARTAIMPDNPDFNFNPHLNTAYWAPAELLFDSSQNGNNAELNGILADGIDPGMLDGLPGAPLDFAHWDAYFSKTNQTSTTDSSNVNAMTDGQNDNTSQNPARFASTPFGMEAEIMDVGSF